MKTKRYGWHSEQAPHTEEYLTQPILNALNQADIERVLDIGSGNGALCGKISEQGFIAHGIESDAEGVEIARKAYPEVQFQQLDIEEASFNDLKNHSPFDAVVSTEVIEHLYQPRKLVQLAHQSLRDQGLLIISTPYHGYLKNLTLALFNHFDTHWNPLWDGGHIKFWSRRTLSRLLEEEHFAVEQFIGVGRAQWLWKSMILIARKSSPSND